MAYLPDALVLLAGVPWFVFGLLIIGDSGLSYFRLTGTQTGRIELEAVRQMGLGFAGLLFAGLSVGLSSSGASISASTAAATDPLIIGLVCALVAWIVTNQGTYVWVAYLSAALITASVGALLVGVFELAQPTIGVEAAVALGFGMTAVVGFSVRNAATYWRAGRAWRAATDH